MLFRFRRRTPDLLFAYGTLRDPDIQLLWFGRRVAATPDQLAGFSMGEITLADQGQQRCYPIIAASGESAELVSGAVLALSAAELAAADRYEGDDYVRIRVRLVSGRQAWVYAKP